MSTNEETRVTGIDAKALVSYFKSLDEKVSELQEKVKGNPRTVLLTRQQVAELFNVSVVTIDEWRKKNLFPCYKIGNKVRFVQADVLEAMELQTSKPV